MLKKNTAPENPICNHPCVYRCVGDVIFDGARFASLHCHRNIDHCSILGVLRLRLQQRGGAKDVEVRAVLPNYTSRLVRVRGVQLRPRVPVLLSWTPKR